MFSKILHPSDFSQFGDPSFAHALKLALLARGQLTVLQIRPGASDRLWVEFPGVRHFLARWGVLPETATKEDVADLGLIVRKRTAKISDPVRAIRHSLKRRGADLVVISCHRASEFPRWARHEVAGSAVRRHRTCSLFLPDRSAGFISTQTGEPRLHKVLLPVARAPHPQPALDAVVALGTLLGSAKLAITALHAGRGEIPDLRFAERPGWSLAVERVSGDPVTRIHEAADSGLPDLVAMTTRGRVGLLNALRGSTSERVLRGLVMPLLVAPPER